MFTGTTKVGYDGAFQRYTTDDIMMIVRDLTDLSMPALPEGDFSAVVSRVSDLQYFQKN